MQKFSKPSHSLPGFPRGQPLVDKLVCWDLDETLGRFYGIYARMHGHSGYTGIDGLKPGIRDAIAELSNLGFSHVVTTAAPEAEAGFALEKAGLLKSFLRIFPDSVILNGERKDYSVVADAFHMGEDDFRSRVIVVGDIIGLDAPENGVFIWEPDSPNYSARAVTALIRLILENGSGDIWAGFGDLFSRAARLPSPGSEEVRGMRISEGFVSALCYAGGCAIASIAVEDESLRTGIEPI